MSELDAALEQLGLIRFGNFALTDDDADLPLHVGGVRAQSGTLIGNAGSAVFPTVSTSPEFRDGQMHPLDRWTKRQIDEIADQMGYAALYPFGGPPWWPFIRWANRLGVFSQSPLGVLVHAEYGPWIAFRAVLLTIDQPADAHRTITPGPCPSCIEKPCLSACPVNAVHIDLPYEAERCRSYVRETFPDGPADGKTATCSTGCQARKACPIGQSYRYTPDHGRFHMAAFARRPG